MILLVLTLVYFQNISRKAEISPGSAYVFHKTSTWTELVKLRAANGYNNDQFGYSVAIQGTTVVVGAIDVDLAGAMLQIIT